MTLSECKIKFPLYRIIESMEVDNVFGTPGDNCDGYVLRYWKIVGYCDPSQNNQWLPVVLTKNGQIKWYYPSLSGWKISDENLNININEEKVFSTVFL